MFHVVLSIFLIGFSYSLTAQDSSDIDYGEVFFEDSQNFQQAPLTVELGYALDLNQTYLDYHSLAGQFQFRIWDSLSTGILGFKVFPQYTGAGNQLRSLRETADLIFETNSIQWGLFSHSQLQFMVGQWNVLNLFPLQLNLLLGGGAGVLRKKNEFSGVKSSRFSYLWSVEQRAVLFRNLGIFISFFGVDRAVFVHPGVMGRLSF